MISERDLKGGQMEPHEEENEKRNSGKKIQKTTGDNDRLYSET